MHSAFLSQREFSDRIRRSDRRGVVVFIAFSGNTDRFRPRPDARRFAYITATTTILPYFRSYRDPPRGDDALVMINNNRYTYSTRWCACDYERNRNRPHNIISLAATLLVGNTNNTIRDGTLFVPFEFLNTRVMQTPLLYDPQLITDSAGWSERAILTPILNWYSDRTWQIRFNRDLYV